MDADQTSTAEVYNVIGRRIRETRRKRGISQATLAEHVGLNRTSIANIESGKQKLLVHTLYLFSDALAISVQDLLEMPSAAPAPTQDFAELELPNDIPEAAREWVMSDLRGGPSGNYEHPA